MNKNLTDAEQNVVKDILKLIGKDDEMNESFAAQLGMDLDDFNEIADLIFEKLQNGRLTIES